MESSVAADTAAHPPKPVRAHPVMTLDTEFFWKAAREHKLAIQRCSECSKLRHPPLPCCPHCHSFEWDTVESARKGTLMSFTVVHAPMVSPFTEPYAVGLIELEEGTRLVAGIVDTDAGRLKIGVPVTVEFLDCEGDLALPMIRIASNDVTGR